MLRLAELVGSGLLFPSSYLEMQEDFRLAQIDLGLEDIAVLYRIRHGGPSHDRAFRHRTAQEIKSRGTWASDSSVARYEAHARLQQVEARLPALLQDWAAKAPALVARELPLALRATPLDNTLCTARYRYVRFQMVGAGVSANCRRVAPPRSSAASSTAVMVPKRGTRSSMKSVRSSRRKP